MQRLIQMKLQDLANPMVRKHMRFYPEEPADGVVSEVWHGVKWRRDLKVNHLTPMCVHPHLGKHFYVQEVAEHMDGRLVIPVRWIVRSNVLHADAHVLIPTDKGLVGVTWFHSFDEYTNLKDRYQTLAAS